MNDEEESAASSKPRLCERCGSRMPPQKRGRPRRWCSQQCRQSAYEERHGLESWKDKQPKISDLSDVVEVAQDRAASRSGGRHLTSKRRPVRASHDCVSAVCSDQLYMAMVVDAVADLVSANKLVDTLEGRFLAQGVARLVEAVHMAAFNVVRTGNSLGTNSDGT